MSYSCYIKNKKLALVAFTTHVERAALRAAPYIARGDAAKRKRPRARPCPEEPYQVDSDHGSREKLDCRSSQRFIY